ncbi:hypothetical protein BKE38_16945 [Pseudoroseomonas deserti]|uniref:Uncharacterized protein n=1 Tax=Teichococcus deserti TaxID=1817963 RepID=A0A1V2H0U8_9PROT|nr:alpha/beta fold hydrolase [Pseudoroseomonas deserti]ONG50987.1 hypothetical protein BKE38_16945 [Pseudoroseomonas deserti]
MPEGSLPAAVEAPRASAAPRPLPVAFGGCTGWFHAAARPTGRAVLMLAPDGYEALCSRRPWRELAARLAEAGLSVLRYDHPGEGSSDGIEELPPDFSVCADTAVEAAALLKRLSGAAEVSVLGMRMGAMVAGLAAARMDAAPLALLYPVLSGRLHGREMRVQSDRGPEGPEFLGFPWTDAAIAALSGLDLPALLAAAPPRPVLILAQPRIAEAAGKAALSLPDARTIASDGYDDLVAEAHAVKVPEPAFDAIIQFLAKDAPESLATVPEPAGRPVIQLAGGGTEETVCFGPNDGLVGALTLPARGLAPGGPALVILNTGVNHHVGNGRLSVIMARRAAAAGMAVLRYDARAHGESHNPDGLPLVKIVQQPAVVDDSRAALDLMQRLGFPSVVIAGNCAGGWTALHAALADARIKHAVVINLQRFIWTEGRTFAVPSRRQTVAERQTFQWRALIEARRNGASALDMLRAVTPNRYKMAWKRSVVRSMAHAGRVLPPRLAGILGPGRVAGWLRALSTRGTGVSFVYSDQDTGLEELESHFGDGGKHLAGLRGMALVLVPGADHTFSNRTMRRELLDRVDAIIAAVK